MVCRDAGRSSWPVMVSVYQRNETRQPGLFSRAYLFGEEWGAIALLVPVYQISTLTGTESIPVSVGCLRTLSIWSHRLLSFILTVVFHPVLFRGRIFCSACLENLVCLRRLHAHFLCMIIYETAMI